MSIHHIALAQRTLSLVYSLWYPRLLWIFLVLQAKRSNFPFRFTHLASNEDLVRMRIVQMYLTI
jgi:hypothetical protein